MNRLSEPIRVFIKLLYFLVFSLITGFGNQKEVRERGTTKKGTEFDARILEKHETDDPGDDCVEGVNKNNKTDDNATFPSNVL